MQIFKRLFRMGCWMIGRLLPVNKKKVVFSSYNGRGYSDNPKAIAQAMLDAKIDAKLIWLVKNEKEAATLPDGITPCPFDSAKKIWALSTARVWVDNCRKYAKFKKKNQYYLQTWHGFPLKRIEKDAEEALGPDYVRGAMKDSRQFDLLLSNSAFETEVWRRCFWYDGEIAQFGSPRNDVFFQEDPEVLRKVRKMLHLPEDQKLVLYAPTFRADHSMDAYALDTERLQKACCEKFGGNWTVLVRLHPNIAAQSAKLFPYDGNRIVDATMYPDMQELLCASDILITDYSSSMFDFSLSGKPCFLFALDIGAYMADRNFYFDIMELPFPVADSNDAMVALVASFDEEAYHHKRNDFYEQQGFCEDGKASARCARWIEERLK